MGRAFLLVAPGGHTVGAEGTFSQVRWFSGYLRSPLHLIFEKVKNKLCHTHKKWNIGVLRNKYYSKLLKIFKSTIKLNFCWSFLIFVNQNLIWWKRLKTSFKYMSCSYQRVINLVHENNFQKDLTYQRLTKQMSQRRRMWLLRCPHPPHWAPTASTWQLNARLLSLRAVHSRSGANHLKAAARGWLVQGKQAASLNQVSKILKGLIINCNSTQLH